MCTDYRLQTKRSQISSLQRWDSVENATHNLMKINIYENLVYHLSLYNSSAWEYLWNIKNQKQNEHLRKPLKVSTPRAAKYNIYVDNFLPKNLLISS